MLLYLQGEPSRKGGNFGQIFANLTEICNFSPCSHIRVPGFANVHGSQFHIHPWDVLSASLRPCQGVHSSCCSGSGLSKLILGSNSCLDAKYSKQSTLSLKYFAPLPESIPGMSREEFIRVRKLPCLLLTGNSSICWAGIGCFDCKHLYNMQFCTGSRQSGF